MDKTLIADLIAAGVQFEPHEAVAIAQQLIGAASTSAGSPPASPLCPPSPGNVHLHADGSVTCDGYQVRPAVFEIAILLQTLLPPGGTQVPGALRYAIARGLLDVDAPPFDSIEEFSRGLERFERAERRAVVRALLARAQPLPVVTGVDRARVVRASDDRRRNSPSATLLRRELREADRQLYETTRPIAVPTPSIAKQRSWRLPVLAAALAGGVAFAAVAELAFLRAPRPAVSRESTSEPGGSAAAVVAPAMPAVPQPIRPERMVPPETDTRTDRPLRSNQPVAVDPMPRRNLPAAPDPRRRPDRAATATPPPYLQAAAPPPVAAAPTLTTEGELVPALDRQQRPVFSPAFASNGAAMFFHTGGTRDARSALAMMPASPAVGDDLRVMTIVDDGARNYHVQPSPDGQFIAFDSDRDGDRGVYLANSDGTHVRRISGPGYAAVPTWAPDGRRVAYIRAEPDNPKVWNLWLQSLDAAEPKRLTNYRFGQPWSASWFPDNRRICYTHEDKVIILDLDTGGTREFASPVKGGLVRTPAVSPDGTKVIFQVFRKGAWVLDLADGSMRCVLSDATAEEFAWAPDGRRVAFHSRRDGEWGIYIMHPD